MPILSPIGRKQPKTRLLIAAIYVVLSLGALTMVYPFLLMISGSFKSHLDRQDWDIIPRYLHDDTLLFRKFVESKYNESLAAANSAYRTTYYSFENVAPPPRIHERAVADYREFLACGRLRDDWRTLGFIFAYQMAPQNLRLLINELRSQCAGDIRKFNDRYGSTYERWDDIRLSLYAERWIDRHYQEIQSPLGPFYRKLRDARPHYESATISLDGDFLERRICPQFGEFSVARLNEAYGTNLATFADLHLPARVPANPAFAKDWEIYVRTLLHPRFIRFDKSARPAFELFLRQKYETLVAFNHIHGTHYREWADCPLPDEVSTAGATLADAMQFLESAAPRGAIEITGPEFQFRAFLKHKYGDLAALRQAHGIEYASFDTVPLPEREYDWVEMQAHHRAVVREFVVRNYAIVLDYLFLHGRALWNTLIFCALAIVTALLVNPLAAYALSRYQLPSQYKLLFFLMATMAFPAEVTLIPGFLLLKQLHLLNTFWALVLPAAANGYAIFLLKGFFDSLPRELYESAMMDGAGEWTMFWQVTMSLSKPILVVIALGAFTAAYGAFMFALIVCQNEKMWTIMVYLYQLQQRYAQPVVFASLLVAAIPTLLVFVFCQNIIMRGIVVPVEK